MTTYFFHQLLLALVIRLDNLKRLSRVKKKVVSMMKAYMSTNVWANFSTVDKVRQHWVGLNSHSQYNIWGSIMLLGFTFWGGGLQWHTGRLLLGIDWNNVHITSHCFPSQYLLSVTLTPSTDSFSLMGSHLGLMTVLMSHIVCDLRTFFHLSPHLQPFFSETNPGGSSRPGSGMGLHGDDYVMCWKRILQLLWWDCNQRWCGWWWKQKDKIMVT